MDIFQVWHWSICSDREALGAWNVRADSAENAEKIAQRYFREKYKNQSCYFRTDENGDLTIKEVTQLKVIGG